MTSFSDEEEIEFGTAENAPWLLANTLRQRGAHYEKGPNWGAFIVRDGNLLTGQNPASTGMLADAVVEVLRSYGPQIGSSRYVAAELQCDTHNTTESRNISLRP